jgi:hypothetical protein
LDSVFVSAMTNSEPAIVRGALLLGVQAWIKEDLPNTAAQDFKSQLLPDDARLLTGRHFVNQSPIPAEQFRRICDQIIRIWGIDGPRGFRKIAGRIAISDLKGYMKVLLRMGTPSFVLHRFPRVWHHYFSHGSLEVAEAGDGTFQVTLRDASIYGDGAIEGNIGWMQAALEYSGARGVKVIKTPTSDPDNVVYSVSWS